MTVFDLGINLLEASLFGLFFWQISNQSRARKGIAFVFYSVLHFLLMSYINRTEIMAGYRSLIFYMLAYICLSIGSDFSAEGKLFFSLIPDLITAVINTYLLIAASYFMFGRIEILFLLEQYGVIVTLISKPLQLLALHCAAAAVNQKKEYLDRREFLLAACMAFLCLMMFNSIEELLFYQKFDGEKISIAVICLGGLVVLFWVTVWAAAKRNQKIREEQKMNEMMALQLRSTKENMRISESLSRMKHDVRHMISLLADSGGSEELIRKYRKELDSLEIPIETKSRALNDILHAEQERASENGLHFRCVLNVSSEPFLSEDDLIVLLMNSLDNAILHISGGNEINLMIRSNSRFFLLKVENPISTEGQRAYETYLGKADRSGKYGLRSARVIAEKYGGDIRVKCKDGVFSFSAIAHADSDQLVKGM